MRSWVFGAAAIAVLAVAGIFFFGSSSRDVSAGAEDGLVVLHRGNGAEPSSLDPHRMTGVWESRIVTDMMEGLYTRGPNDETLFAVATSHEMSEDGLTHTFTLRDDAYWSDGVPVTADDFVYSFRRMVNPETAAEFASFHYIIVNAREINTGQISDLTQLGVRALDDHTLEIQLVRPFPYLDDLLKTYLFLPVPRHVVEEYGDRWSRAGTMVTNGAYVLDEWVPNDFIRVRRNEYFHDNDDVQIDEVYYYPTTDESAGLRRFRAGEIDLDTGFPEQQIAWLREHFPTETRVDPSLCVGYIVMNTEREPFNDVRVRQALAMSIDRETLSQRVLSLGERPAYSIVSPFADNYPAPAPYWVDLSFPERQELARNLLSEAGFDASHPLAFTYRYRESIRNRRAAIAVSRMWSEIGIAADIVNTEPAIHYDDLRAGNYQVGDAGWCPTTADPADILLLVHSDYAELNSPNYFNPEFDEPYNEALLTVDPVRRNELMAQAETIMLRDMPLTPTFYYMNKNLVGAHVIGWEDNPANAHNTRWLSIDESRRPVHEGLADQIMRWFN